MPDPENVVYRHRLSVRFRDCDAMAHVNHAVYFTYCESGGDPLIASGKTVMGSYDYAANTSTPLPAETRELLQRLKQDQTRV